MRRFSHCRIPISAGVLAMAAVLFAGASGLADIYTDLPSQLVGYDSSGEIHIHSAADATAVRQNVVNYFWGNANLPTKLPTSTTVYTGGGTLPADLAGLKAANIASAEKWQANMDFGYSTSMYLLRPVNTSNAQRLVIVHHGHVGYSGRFSLGIGTVTNDLLRNGFTVLEMQMPLMGWNAQTNFSLPSGTVSLTSHNAMVDTLEGQSGGSSLRFFLEPVIQGINKFVQTTPNYTDISMTGLSGGGWTTTLAAAIDPRIKLSIPVAGSVPLYVRPYYPGSMGDKEQYLSTMYDANTGKASYLDLYTLGSTGAGRRQIQLLNQYDDCCFYGVAHQTWVNNVKTAVGDTGSGTYDFYLDSTVHSHQISTNAINNVIFPALGVTPIPPPIPPPPAINEQFSAVGTPPPGWSYDPRNGTSPPVVISGTGTEAQFSSGGGVKSIVGDSTFDPLSVPITATIRIKSVGSGGFLGMFFTDDPYTRTHHFGLQVKSDGQLILNTDHGSLFKQDMLTTLAGYTGGPITLKLTFDANGFLATTDVGSYTSGRRTFASLTNGKLFRVNDIGMEAFPFLQYYAGTSVGTVDWFTVAPADFTWSQANGGTWSIDANWTAKWAPNGAGVTARFTNPVNPGASVILNAAATVGKLHFDNTASYKISGASTLSLSPGYLGTNRIEVVAGSHEIAVPIIMNAPTEVNVATGATLTLSGAVGGAGNLIKSGAGDLILTQNTAYTGDTTVNDGQLILLGTLNTPAANVKVLGGAVLTAPSLAANALTIGGQPVTAVPEPGAWALITLAGILGGLAIMRPRRQA